MRGALTLDLLRAAQATGLLEGTPEELLAEARRSGQDPLSLASERRRLPREAFYRALAAARGLEFRGADRLEADPALLERAPLRLLERRAALPLARQGSRVQVALSDPDDETTLETLRRLYGELSPALAEPQAIRLALRRQTKLAREGGEDFDAVAFLDDLLHQAWLRRASDVHLDPQPEGLVLRLRVDGELSATGGVLGPSEAAAVISRVKVLGGLDIAERRFPQDGSFDYRPSGAGARGFDVRVATIPTRHGERATLRLLGVEARGLTIDRLGLEPNALGRLREALSQPYGMVLLTGPTGSGKTTTLYAALTELASPQRSVLSVEDPVERSIRGVSQVQVGGKVSFADALRALLRHDPDVLMVGEIRDGETADVAVKAAMTGHMVLSSLHTNRAAAAPARLVDLGCERFLVGSVLRACLAQRLVRRLCPACLVRRRAEPGELRALDPCYEGQEPVEVAEPSGCPACVGTGYAGRLALVEALWVDDAVTAAIEAGAREETLRELSRPQGNASLGADALRNVLAGRTSLREALRVRI